MAPQWDDHAATVDALEVIFVRDQFWVRSQSPLRTGTSSPESDVAVMSYPRRGGRTVASAVDALLVIEVDDSTLAEDLIRRISLYAAASCRSIR